MKGQEGQNGHIEQRKETRAKGSWEAGLLYNLFLLISCSSLPSNENAFFKENNKKVYYSNLHT